MTARFGCQVGTFLDHVQQRQVLVQAFGDIEYRASNPTLPPEEMDRWVGMKISGAVKTVITDKMHSGALTFRHLGTGQIGAVLPEIIATSGLAQQGIQIGNLDVRFTIDGHGAPQQQPQQQQMQQPQQQQPQHVVEARFQVAGLNINASSDRGLDAQGLQNQLKDKAKSNIIWYGVGCGILFVVGLGILGLGFYIWHSVKTGMESSSSSTSTTRSAAASKWDGTSTFNCGGSDVITLTGVKASAGITAGGSCKLTLTGCDITAPIPIDASGSAQVTITGGSLTGSTAAVQATGAAKVTMVGTKVTGKKDATGAAKITGP